MEIVRLYDPARRPPNWTEIVRPGQLAVFATDTATGAACDLDGGRFVPADAATCAIVDSLAEARTVCDGAVARHPLLRLDVFDADGRSRPPLLTVLRPDRSASLEQAPRQVRRRRTIAWTLIACGIPLVGYAGVMFEDREREIILPAFLGINMILYGGRLLWLNLALRETERAREERLRQLGS